MANLINLVGKIHLKGDEFSPLNIGLAVAYRHKGIRGLNNNNYISDDCDCYSGDCSDCVCTDCNECGND